MNLYSIINIGLVAILMLCLFIIQKIVKIDSNKVRLQKILLLVASYIFISIVDYRFAVCVFIISLVSYIGSKYLKLNTVAILFSLIFLGYFKYTNFFIESFENIVGNDYTALHIILPLGISFYVFSAISYLVDVKRGEMKHVSFVDVAIYLSFFPKFISGPIQRSKEFFSQIDIPLKVTKDNISTGMQIFAFGLFKKLVLADHLSVFVNQVYYAPTAFNSFTVYLAAVAYSFQLYFDFSGYSDMAIGIARILGIHLPDNFNIPYLAFNVTEFWKRWHMSLSSWLRDYLYIPLGGNRKGALRTYFNLIATMLLGGLWHGAAWTYVIWGGLHGIALAFNKIWSLKVSPLNNTFTKIVSVVVTFHFVTLCWIFFRAESFSKALLIIHQIISGSAGISQPYFWLFFDLLIFAVSIVFAYMNNKKENISFRGKANENSLTGTYLICDLSSFWGLVVFFVLIGLTLSLAYTGGSPFIYGQY